MLKIAFEHESNITISDHMFKEVIKHMKHDKLIAEDELPAPENIEDETAEVIEVINKSQEKLPPIN